MNTVTKLDHTHRDIFYKFIDAEIAHRKLETDPLWQNILFIEPDRDIFAIIQDNEIKVCVAIEYIKTMPWCIHNTFIMHHRINGFAGIKLTKKIYDYVFAYTENKGIWSHWYARTDRLNKALKSAKFEYEGVKQMSRYGNMLAKVIGDRYSIADRAYVKAGHLTGIALYDRLMLDQALPYDVTLRQITIKQSAVAQGFGERITYG